MSADPDQGASPWVRPPPSATDEHPPGLAGQYPLVALYTEDYWIGTAALHEGRPADAIVPFERVPGHSPCWVMAQGNVGLALLTMNRYQEAERRLLCALREIRLRGCFDPPAHIQFVRNLGEALAYQQRWTEACEAFWVACRTADALAERHPALAARIERAKAHTLNSASHVYLKVGLIHQAIAALNAARGIYRRCSGQDREGHAEVLTNLALAYDAADRTTAAVYALEEAADIAGETEDLDQLFRIFMAGVGIGSELRPTGEVLDLVEAGAADALAAARPGIAYLRYCQGALYAIRRGQAAAGLRLVALARGVEGRLDPSAAQVPTLRFLEANLLRLAGEPPPRYTNALIDGARHWHDRVAVPLVPADFRRRASDLHLHVRTLAGCLLEAGRHDEALVAFDTGRALGYAVEVDQGYYSQRVAANPFEAGGTIDTEPLRRAQRGLGPGEAAVVLAVIPPRLLAFVVDRASVECLAADATQADLYRLDAFNKALPVRVPQGVGMRAVHAANLALARAVCDAVGPRRVASFIPYDSQHMVPWRAVLRQRGLPWDRLAFAVGFNFLLRHASPADEGIGRGAISLGWGVAGEVDLREEARQFVRPFGGRGRMLPGCTAADVRRALQEDAIVLLSCHGQVANQVGGPALFLDLADGSAPAEEVFPPRVASPLVILSACHSGVYHMAWGDYPLGAGPLLLRRGAGAVIGARFPIDARYAAAFFAQLAGCLAAGGRIETAFAGTLAAMEVAGADPWRDLACLELLRAV